MILGLCARAASVTVLTMRNTRRRLGPLWVALVLLAGCGGNSGADHPRATATTTGAGVTASAVSRQCSQTEAGAQDVRFRTTDGVTLSGAVVGNGPVGAVLIHEYPLDLCGWLPYAGYLSRHGVRALLFDLRCFGRSPCPASGRGRAVTDVAAAIAELRRRGTRRVALVGASMGGSIAVVAGARLRPAAIVDLSGERDTSALTPGISANAGAAAPGVTAPALFAVARGDRYVPVADMRAVARRVRSPTRRLIVLPAEAGHGWDTLSGTSTTWSPLAATVASFIRRHAGGGAAQRPAPRPLQHCPSAGDGWRALPTSGDAYAPPAARLGRGRVGVVFANDSENDSCAWSGEARALAAQGFAVAVFETVGSDAFEAREVAPVARALRREGARRVVLVGASVGARAVLQAGAQHPPGVTGLVALSAERRVGSAPADLLPAGRRVRVPVLTIGSRRDPLTSFGKDTLAWHRTIPDDRAMIVSGSAHGVELLGGRHGRRVRAAILAFLERE